MKNSFTKNTFLFLFIVCFFVSAGAQESADVVKDRNWRIEAEPGSFVLRGFNLHVSRNVTRDNNLNIGFYFLSLDIPSRIQKGMFENIYTNADVRLGFEAAFVARYKFPLWKDHETNPYLGVIAGWEYFDIKHANLPDVRITTWVFTPFVGYEIYVFRKMVFINPQLRGVIYLSEHSEPMSGPGNMEPFFLLPAVSVGVRL
jgi:hypothetical protein